MRRLRREAHHRRGDPAPEYGTGTVSVGGAHLGLHRDVVETVDLIEQGREELDDPRFADRRGQVQDPQVLDVGPSPCVRPNASDARRKVIEGFRSS
jgi:hypothetical protein